MKVMQINVIGNLSTGKIAADLSRTLIASGHDCLFAYSRGKAPADIPTYRIGSDADVRIHALMSRLTDRTGFYSAGATRRLIEKIREYDPDIIHLHNVHGYFVHIGLLFDFLRGFGRPVVWTMHDCWTFTGHCSYFDEEHPCRKWLTGCGGCENRHVYPTSLFFDRSRRNFADKKRLFASLGSVHIVTPSKWLARLFEQSFMNVYPISVINNGIDQSIFRPTEGDFREKNGLIGKKVLLGVASPWSERKGLGDFIKLSSMIDDDTRIVLIGLSDEQIASLPGNIIGLRRTDSAQQLAEIYSTADLFINPTHQDNFPTVNIEALSCGTPVITYDVGGSAEAADETCGRAVPLGDIKGLLHEINTFTADSDACLRRAQLYTKQRAGSQYLEIYNSLTGTK